MTPARARASASPLHRLAEAAGIVSRYQDQTGREWRETTDETRRALLAGMGLDASTPAAVAATLAALRAEASRELVAPVRVVARTDAGAAILPAALPSAPARGTTTTWELTTTTETRATATSSGTWRRGARARLPIPWPGGDAPLGYHRLTLRVTSDDTTHEGEQTLIIVRAQAVAPAELLGPEERGFGFVANLYAARGEYDWGVGDFGVLRALVDWADDVGAAFVGVNPLHALLNRGTDISPYSPVSRLFRNPLYMDVEAIPELRHAPAIVRRLDHPEREEELDAVRSSPTVCYEDVMAHKTPILEALHEVFVARERSERSVRGRAYDAYCAEHDPELTDFATWLAIGESLDGQFDWRRWPEPLRDARSEAVRAFRDEHAARVDYHRWIQFELDRQLGDIAAAARRDGLAIGLYQDLAIGTSPAGADTWMMPHLFLRGASIGAPPDAYAATGQNWGLPPIDPRALRRDRYRYFVRLVRAGLRHAGALRIDHVMGLFRLFVIPEGETGEAGAYITMPHADLLGILALESVRHAALVVGEDLGTVPPEVRPALAQWGILTSKVLYFERDDAGGFLPPSSYPALSLATANTHDMATLAGFRTGRDLEARVACGQIATDDALAAARAARAQERAALVARLVAEGLAIDETILDDDIAFRAAIHALLCRSGSALVGLTLDDLAGETDAVNIPGVAQDVHPSWTRRMRQTVDELRESDDVRRALACAEREPR